MLNKTLLSARYHVVPASSLGDAGYEPVVVESVYDGGPSSGTEAVNVLSIDVEDYFHPSELGGNIKSWTTHNPRVDVGVNFLLEILAERQIRATFFILGWIATHHPRLVRRIADAGHEIGCHSNLHRLVYRLSPDEFRQDTVAAVRAIEDASGATPRMYRAPSYSVTKKSLWALQILSECGFTHDSSIYPIAHDRYGIPQFPRHASYVSTPAGGILEVPVATVRLGRQVVPVGGGAYMRLFPYRYIAAGLRRVNHQENQPACLYFHPWELDPDQPRLAKSMISRLRTYSGLRGMCAKMKRLLDEFRFSTLTEVFPSPDILPVVEAGTARATTTRTTYSRPGRIALEPVSYYGADMTRTCE